MRCPADNDRRSAGSRGDDPTPAHPCRTRRRGGAASLILAAAALVACAGDGGTPAPASPASQAWLQSVEGRWTRDAAALARMQAQSEGTVGLVVDSAARTATVTQLARLGGTLPPVVARFEGMSGDAGRFRANIAMGGRFATCTYTCRLADPRSLQCRMQIDGAGGWDATFIRPGA